ncbi:WXG100-like domain-containing protein, partial [Streptomyces humidus]
MGDLRVSDEFNAVLIALIGSALPQASETGAKESSRKLLEFGRRMRALENDINYSVQHVGDSLPGDAGRSYVRALSVLTGANGGTNYLQEYQKSLRDVAAGHRDQSLNIQESKWQIIAELIRLVIELTILAATAWINPAAAGQAAAAKARSTTAFLTTLDLFLRRTHLMPSLSEALEEAFQTLVVRLGLMAFNSPDMKPHGVDWRAIGQSAAIGGAAGWLSGPLRGFADSFNGLFGREMSRDLAKDLPGDLTKAGRDLPPGVNGPSVNAPSVLDRVFQAPRRVSEFVADGLTEALPETLLAMAFYGVPFSWSAFGTSFWTAGVSQFSEGLLHHGVEEGVTGLREATRDAMAEGTGGQSSDLERKGASTGEPGYGLKASQTSGGLAEGSGGVNGLTALGGLAGVTAPGVQRISTVSGGNGVHLADTEHSAEGTPTGTRRATTGTGGTTHTAGTTHSGGEGAATGTGVRNRAPEEADRVVTTSGDHAVTPQRTENGVHDVGTSADGDTGTTGRLPADAMSQAAIAAAPVMAATSGTAGSVPAAPEAQRSTAADSHEADRSAPSNSSKPARTTGTEPSQSGNPTTATTGQAGDRTSTAAGTRSVNSPAPEATEEPGTALPPTATARPTATGSPQIARSATPLSSDTARIATTATTATTTATTDGKEANRRSTADTIATPLGEDGTSPLEAGRRPATASDATSRGDRTVVGPRSEPRSEPGPSAHARGAHSAGDSRAVAVPPAGLPYGTETDAPDSVARKQHMPSAGAGDRVPDPSPVNVVSETDGMRSGRSSEPVAPVASEPLATEPAGFRPLDPDEDLFDRVNGRLRDMSRGEVSREEFERIRQEMVDEGSWLPGLSSVQRASEIAYAAMRQDAPRLRGGMVPGGSRRQGRGRPPQQVPTASSSQQGYAVPTASSSQQGYAVAGTSAAGSSSQAWQSVPYAQVPGTSSWPAVVQGSSGSGQSAYVYVQQGVASSYPAVSYEGPAVQQVQWIAPAQAPVVMAQPAVSGTYFPATGAYAGATVPATVPASVQAPARKITADAMERFYGQYAGMFSLFDASRVPTFDEVYSHLDHSVFESRLIYSEVLMKEMRSFHDELERNRRQRQTEATTMESSNPRIVRLYRKMARSEAGQFLSSPSYTSGLRQAMAHNRSDDHRKFFTTSLTHTRKFSNVNAASHDEVVLEFQLDRDAYWAFVRQFGTPSQEQGAYRSRNSAVMNQEQLRAGTRANFTAKSQVDTTIAAQENHNIGIGHGNQAYFGKAIREIRIVQQSEIDQWAMLEQQTIVAREQREAAQLIAAKVHRMRDRQRPTGSEQTQPTQTSYPQTSYPQPIQTSYPQSAQPAHDDQDDVVIPRLPGSGNRTSAGGPSSSSRRPGQSGDRRPMGPPMPPGTEGTDAGARPATASTATSASAPTQAQRRAQQDAAALVEVDEGVEQPVTAR